MTKRADQPQSSPPNKPRDRAVDPEISLVRKDSPDDFSPEREAAPDAQKQPKQ